jgi:hypothetical protein
MRMAQSNGKVGQLRRNAELAAAPTDGQAT